MTLPTVHLLDYGAGNVQSVIHALESLNVHVCRIETAEELADAQCLIFPGVGAFSTAMDALKTKGLDGPLKEFIRSGKPFLGICIGMQVLYESSDESAGVAGLGVFQGKVGYLGGSGINVSIPHMGWNGVRRLPATSDNQEEWLNESDYYYFVHSYGVLYDPALYQGAFSLTRYGPRVFVSAVRRGNVFATQFHPEKSGRAGLAVIQSFLNATKSAHSFDDSSFVPKSMNPQDVPGLFTKRIIACLDVRTDDQNELVVTKGDQYDVRETGDNQVRNLGNPIELAARYYEEGADELVFLNITSFRSCPLQDLPMLKMLKEASKRIFIPLTVGGGIRSFKEMDEEGRVLKVYSALEVADQYFRSGADKVSIGSDAVVEAENFWNRLETCFSTESPKVPYAQLWETAQTQECTKEFHAPASSVEMISKKYGRQAVVISVDPKRVYVKSPSDTRHFTTKMREAGPNGEEYCWYACTIHGGRQTRDLDVVQLALAMEALGAGELLVNCIDRDGQKNGYDFDLLRIIKSRVGIPVVASSGAGNVRHFSDVLSIRHKNELEKGYVEVDAALAAGIFHRREVPILEVKNHLISQGIFCRPVP